MPLRLLFLLLVSLALCGSSPAQSDAIDTFVKSEMEKQRIVGLSLAVVRDGKVVRSAGYGFADMDRKAPVKTDSVFKIGSISKQFIATGIMLLVQDGKISLTDPVGKYLEGTPDSWKDVTIWHLLTHTSGIVREGPAFNPAKAQNDIDVIKSAYPLPLVFPTGTSWQYCNVGYFALAEIIARVSGQSWPDFFTQRVFKPTGMLATRTTTTTEVVPNRVIGYVRNGGEQKVAPDYVALRPSGAFFSTVLDLARWDATLYTDKILKASTREQMWKPAAQTTQKHADGTFVSYGLGWFIDSLKGHRLVYHGGSLPGFQSSMLKLVDDKLTVIVLTNSNEARPEPIARGVAEFFLGIAKAAAGAK